MTVQEKFDQYLTDYLNLTKEDIKKVQVHIQLRDELEKNLEFKGEDHDETYSFLTGSYSRNTVIRPPKDIDFFVVLNDKKYGNLSPRALLDLLAKTIREILPEKTIFQQTHSITVEFDEEFSIDVIPAFETNQKLYKIPHVSEDEEQWLESNPKVHQEKLTNANTTVNNLLIPIIKLLKAWKRDKYDYVKSFHLELLAVKILENSKIKNYAHGISLFFDQAFQFLDATCIVDPANENNLVDDYLNEGNRKRLKKLISEEGLVSKNAIKLENNDNVDDAIREWNKIFTFNTESKKYLLPRPDHEKTLPYPENLQYKVKVTSKPFNPSLGKYKDNYYSGSRKLPKGWKVRFYIDVSAIPNPKNVLWQVVNTGKEAQKAGDLRGQIHDDQGNNQKDEHTKYSGVHYINCFIIKDNRCIAKDRFFVKIN